LSLFNTIRPVVAFLGDSTFYHAGLPGIINALFNKHNFVLILMENGTTAMTGHQNHPGSGGNFNQATDSIPLRSVLEGLGVKNIYEVEAYQQKKLTQTLTTAIESKQFSVIIASHPCMLLFTRQQRRKGGFTQHHVSIDQEHCTRAHVCTGQFACPSFIRHENGQVTTNTDLCIGDGSCVQTCPSQAILRPNTAQKKEK
ncbi:MAG: 4Fe-4S binding protein, partial [Chitinivibrionales bacterium]|nr:4Fe-4S binding protein [Chitinivibrionales bacterium]